MSLFVANVRPNPNTYNIVSRGKGDRPPGIDSNDLDEEEV